MKQETLTLEPTPYGLSGRPFFLPSDVEVWGRNEVWFGRGVRLEYPNRVPSAIAAGVRLAEEIQTLLASIEAGSFDGEMESLRGRSWSP